jgi:hypothetical protein
MTRQALLPHDDRASRDVTGARKKDFASHGASVRRHRGRRPLMKSRMKNPVFVIPDAMKALHALTGAT